VLFDVEDKPRWAKAQRGFIFLDLYLKKPLYQAKGRLQSRWKESWITPVPDPEIGHAKIEERGCYPHVGEKRR
jgi:hypothetical protein